MDEIHQVVGSVCHGIVELTPCVIQFERPVWTAGCPAPCNTTHCRCVGVSDCLSATTLHLAAVTSVLIVTWPLLNHDSLVHIVVVGHWTFIERGARSFFSFTASYNVLRLRVSRLRPRLLLLLLRLLSTVIFSTHVVVIKISFIYKLYIYI